MKIENIKYDSFSDFINDVLLPGGRLYRQLSGFVYRGERTNKYKLLPGALREEQIDKLFRNVKPINNQEQWVTWQVHAEYHLLRDFYKAANHNGLKVPKVNAISNHYNDDYSSELINRTGTYKWISDDMADLAALAQHYGVLTRLIDWSYDLYVAMYFACIGAIKARETDKFDDDDTFVIWALNAHYIQYLQPTTLGIPLKFVVPPYHDNPNLNAQKGVLSYWEIDVPSGMEQAKELHEGIIRLTDRTPLDELLRKHCNKHFQENGHFVILYKFEILVKECIAAYEHLRSVGYNAAKLFPGYDGVVRDMDELTLYSKIKKIIHQEKKKEGDDKGEKQNVKQ